ncbi:transposase [Niallia endozanthoxylica]|uniref:Transposase n=2 Tax=Niallia endozanthoxylica TaxID=2036016 RepID=A0A5J5HNU3_9BACI|nr:transposase [Niallia endozanthoxylica]
MIKYWDKKMDELKSLRDACEKNYRKRKTKQGNTYKVHSPRWNRFNHALDKAYHKRREQLKTALYTISHELYRRYDLVIVGDYTPTNSTAPFNHMKRRMLNQEKIGEFRHIAEWVAVKLEKYYLLANEHNTTKECCVCGHEEKKDPSIRSFVCVQCGNEFMRDTNSSVNIGRKMGFSLDLQKYKHKLKSFTHIGEARYGKPVLWIENKNNL